MLICEKCKKEHSGSFGSGRFCSNFCSKSRSFSKESLEKRSKASKAYYEKHGISQTKTPEAIKKYSESRIRNTEKKLLNADFSTLKFERMRKRVILEQNEACLSCGLNTWLGEKISLELNHIDGINKNNTRDNLEALCPNCHSLTENWRGRNKIEKHREIDKEHIVNSFLKNNSIRQALISLGLTPKGSNYKRIKKVLTEENIKF